MRVLLGGVDGIEYDKTARQLVYQNLRVVTLFPTAERRRMVIPFGRAVQIWGGLEAGLTQDMPLDDMPGYGDLSDTERWIVLSYRRLLDDYKLIDVQAKEGMLDFNGAATHAAIASKTLMESVHRHLVEEMKKGSSG